MVGVEVTATLTIWALFSSFIIFPLAGLPRWWARTAMTLLVAELLALMAWSYGSVGCLERPCAPLAETGRTAASLDVPLLAAGLIALAVVYGRRLHAHPGNGRPRQGGRSDRRRPARRGA
jgi:hypothetical protein